MKPPQFIQIISAVTALFGLLAVSVEAGEFFCDFNSDVPAGLKVREVAMVEDGVLKLVTSRLNQNGHVIIDSLDEGKPITGFTATFKALIGGGTGADGFGFIFTSIDPAGGFHKSGHPGCNLAVEFDTYRNRAQIAPAIRVHHRDVAVAEISCPALRQQRFVDVLIRLNPDKTLDVVYDNEMVVSNLLIATIESVGRFGMAAATGASTDNHFIDDLRIVTAAAFPAFIERIEPGHQEAAPDCRFEFHLTGLRRPVDERSVRLQLGDEELVPEFVERDGKTVVIGRSPSLREPGSAHKMTLTILNLPAGTPNSHSHSFRVSDLVEVAKP